MFLSYPMDISCTNIESSQQQKSQKFPELENVVYISTFHNSGTCAEGRDQRKRLSYPCWTKSMLNILANNNSYQHCKYS